MDAGFGFRDGAVIGLNLGGAPWMRMRLATLPRAGTRTRWVMEVSALRTVTGISAAA